MEVSGLLKLVLVSIFLYTYSHADQAVKRSPGVNKLCSYALEIPGKVPSSVMIAIGKEAPQDDLRLFGERIA